MKVYIIALLASAVLAGMYERSVAKVAAFDPTKKEYFIARLGKRKPDTAAAVLSAIPFILITGLRYKVGTDYSYYIWSFHSVGYGNGSYFNNPLYCLVERISTWLSTDYVMLYINLALIMIACYWHTIYRLSNFPSYSIIMFVLTNTYFVSLNGVRQGMAMGFLFLSLIYVYERDVKKYIVAVLCAVLFHKGVALFIPIYWLTKRKMDPKWAWGSVIITAAAGFLVPGLIQRGVALMGYAGYLGSGFDEGFETILALINASILGVFCFYAQRASESEDADLYNVLFWMQTIATAALMLSARVPLAKRICWIFSIGQILSLPLFTKFEDSKVGKVVLNGGIIVLFALSIYFGIVVNHAHGVYPYHWIWARNP